MYCDACGRPLEVEDSFCRGCGKELHAAPSRTASPVAAAERRVASHLRLLVVLWIAQGVFLLIPILIVGLLLAPFAQSFHPLLRGIVGVALAALPAACFVAAWGLLDPAPWARTYAIVVAAISLLAYPLGTALGIYTLWVLLPESSEVEYHELAMR